MMKDIYSSVDTAKNAVFSVIFDVLAAICGILGVVLTCDTYGVDTFIYYTNLSNVFAAAACILHAVVTIKELITGNYFLHTAVKYIKLSASVCVGITFFVVLTILAPAYGENGYFFAFVWREMKFVHLLCPLFTAIPFILFDKYPRLPMKACHPALIPTYIYGLVSIYMNMIGKWYGPYFFLRIKSNPPHITAIWFVVVAAISYLIALVILLFNGNRFHAIGNLIKFITKKK